MKRKFFFPIMFVMCSIQAFSQYQDRVGINTDKPETTLHVNGSMKAKNLILDQKPYNSTIPKLGVSEGYSFLLKSTSQNRITTYNVQATGSDVFPAPFGVITFKINTDNSDKDWVNEYDTKINANKYIAVLNYFNFNLPVVSVGNVRRIAPVAQVYTYEKNGTWWIKADYQAFAPPSGSASGLWEINLMVFDKTFAKVSNHNITMSNNTTTGAASSALIVK